MVPTNRSVVTPLDIWAPFWTLAATCGELALAATQTVGHRLNMLAGAGDNPTARERREFFRMGSEKVEAALDSSRAVSVNWNVLNRQLTLLAEAQGQLLAAAAGLAGARTFRELTTAQRRYWEAWAKSGETGLALWLTGMEVARQGLLPIHAKATANARRLGLAELRRR